MYWRYMVGRRDRMVFEGGCMVFFFLMICAMGGLFLFIFLMDVLCLLMFFRLS